MATERVNKCRIDRIIPNADMRRTSGAWEEDFESHGIFTGLRPGHAILMVNRSKTIARMYDAAWGIHTWYADEGEEFDVDKIVEMINDRVLEIGVGVFAGRGIKKGAVPGVSREYEEAA